MLTARTVLLQCAALTGAVRIAVRGYRLAAAQERRERAETRDRRDEPSDAHYKGIGGFTSLHSTPPPGNGIAISYLAPKH